MRSSTPLWNHAAAAAITLAAGGVDSAHADDHPVELSLVSERSAYEPGQTVQLGLRLAMDDGWHVYWPGANDTGFPVAWTLEGPGTPHAPLWPAPRRYVNPGRILDHVHEDELLIILPVTIPADAQPGTELTWNVEAEWLVCKEACIPGDAEASVTVRVGPGKASADAAESFKAARSRLPASESESPRPVRIELSGGTLKIEAKNAAELAFYPAEDARPPVNLFDEGTAKSDRLSIRFGGNTEDPVSGVLEITERDGSFALIQLSRTESR